MVKNIVLTGFMAAGKSSVGRILAQELGWDFLDTDRRIEELTDLKIPEIFRKYGEERFRAEENFLVKKIADITNTVIATGGGTILYKENWQRLQQLGLTIHLFVPLEVALQRVKKRQDRPLLEKSIPEIEQMWKERLIVYNQAEITLDTTDQEIDTLVAEILNQVKGGLPK
ncbi:MAG: shikimate kinase [Gracilibacter sp. BRH_c7a]|nr:MAG: shikimate kinase [Gracilibacter sp. BRH_c7a]